MNLFPYLLIFVGSLLVDCIPVFAPPAWMLMLYILFKFQLHPLITASVGTAGTVFGRLIYVTYIVPWMQKKSIGPKKEADLKFLGEKLSKQGPATLVFVFIYSILPLSTTVLFTAVGLAKVKRRYVVPGFFLGNLIGDGVLLLSGQYAITHFKDFYKDALNTQNILITLAGLLVMLLFVFIDWRALIQKKKIEFKWQFWK